MTAHNTQKKLSENDAKATVAPSADDATKNELDVDDLEQVAGGRLRAGHVDYGWKVEKGEQ